MRLLLEANNAACSSMAAVAVWRKSRIAYGVRSPKIELIVKHHQHSQTATDRPSAWRNSASGRTWSIKSGAASITASRARLRAVKIGRTMRRHREPEKQAARLR